MQLRTALRAARQEAHERVADLHVRADLFALEQLRERACLRLRIVSLHVQLRQPEPRALLEQVVDPVARRVQLQPGTRGRRDERAAAALLPPAPGGLLPPGRPAVAPLLR